MEAASEINEQHHHEEGGASGAADLSVGETGSQDTGAKTEDEKQRDAEREVKVDMEKPGELSVEPPAGQSIVPDRSTAIVVSPGLGSGRLPCVSGPQNRVYLADNTEPPTPGYTLINAGVGAGFTNKKDKLLFNIYLFANNIFDVVYQDHLSRLKYFLYSENDTNPAHGIHNMGRNIALKIDFPLEF